MTLGEEFSVAEGAFARGYLRQVMELADVASEVVGPAVRAVFKEGEVSALALRVMDELAGSVALSLPNAGSGQPAMNPQA